MISHDYFDFILRGCSCDIYKIPENKELTRLYVSTTCLFVYVYSVCGPKKKASGIAGFLTRKLFETKSL